MEATESIQAAPNQDERIMAALSHVTAILPFMGIITPTIVWITQKDKSQYIAFQALQALTYQLTMVLACFVGMVCYMCSFLGSFLGMFTTPALASPSEEIEFIETLLIGSSVILPLCIFGVMFVGGIVFVVYGLIAAVKTLQGKEFRYAIIGARLERYLQRRE
jgi:uncharacterized Tic20 family protein